LNAVERDYSERLNKLIERATEDATRKSLRADKLLNELFERASDLPDPHQSSHREEARRSWESTRERGSYGDAITWEVLLEHHPEARPTFHSGGSQVFSGRAQPDGPVRV